MSHNGECATPKHSPISRSTHASKLYLPDAGDGTACHEPLEDLLNEAIGRREELPLSLKVSILTDVAKGLVYLHNHSPQIIHRDLTSRNVLLTLDMQAKITDLGNALIIDSDTVAQTMTQTPGTAVYMPPEATQYQAKYDSSIDMFSYGHLALYTAIQQFPKDILPPTFKDEVTKLLSARSEIQR